MVQPAVVRIRIITFYHVSQSCWQIRFPSCFECQQVLNFPTGHVLWNFLTLTWRLCLYLYWQSLGFSCSRLPNLCIKFSYSFNHAGSSGNANCSPTLSIESTEVPVRVGSDVIIKCKACGRKNIFWFKNGKRFGETKRVHWISARKISSFPVVVEGKLKIENLRKRDRGIYTCYALDFLTNIMEKGDIKLVGKLMLLMMFFLQETMFSS